MHPREVFVGNLSFFCGERDLLRLFEQYANVEHVHVVRNKEGSRSLMYAFVQLQSVAEAVEVARLFDGHFFMGRQLKVNHEFQQSADHVSERQLVVCTTVYLTIVGDGQELPTETLLRKFFLVHGSIEDVLVKEYCWNQKRGCYLGYAFLVFADSAAAFTVASQPREFSLKGLRISASLSHKPTLSLSSSAKQTDVHARSLSPPSLSLRHTTPPAGGRLW